MNPSIFPPIPRETARAAQSMFGRGNFYLITGDRINQLFQGLSLKPGTGRQLSLTHNQAMLYLITIFQYRETMPDDLVPGAIHDRPDWKYALHLPMSYSYLNPLVLCETRQQLHTGQLEKQYFQALIHRLATDHQLACTQLLNVSADRLLARVCLVSRVSKAWDAINRSLEALAIHQPEWLLDNSLPHWFERYDPIRRSINLNESNDELVASAQNIGADGAYLIDGIDQSNLPDLQLIPEISRLKSVWQEQYRRVEGKFYWRQATCAGCVLASQNGKTITQ